MKESVIYCYRLKSEMHIAEFFQIQFHRKENMFSRILSAAVLGIEAYPVQVEADICNGLPQFCMVGDLSPEVKEASERVRTALKNSGVPFPPKRVTVNLAPASLRKEGTRFDLPLAASLLAAMGIVPEEHTKGVLIAGEVSLSGQVRPVSGILQTVALAGDTGARLCLVPRENACEGAALNRIPVVGVGSLKELLECLLSPEECRKRARKVPGWSPKEGEYREDFREVNGQTAARRAAEIAAAGMHNLLMIGSPGAGKTMIARRMPTILPCLTLEESLEISKVYSACGLLMREEGLAAKRPFRAPHHTISANALAGGGKRVLPGEISLATRGVLFLDELPEFSKNALETLRQPMEEGRIVISRISGNYVFPARFQLVAAMNPCKCGFFPDRSRCRCLPGEIHRYLHRISRPLLDRIDICAEVSRVEYRDLTAPDENENSAGIRSRVETAHRIQSRRYAGLGWEFNSQLDTAAIRQFCPLGSEEQKIMEQAFERMNLSARAYYRIIRVARTIADLEGEPRIRTGHLMEAVGFRLADGKFWGAQ